MEQKIITLCGSSRFKKEFDEVNLRLSKEGYLVFSIVPVPDEEMTPKLKLQLCTKVHLRKIDMSDAIFVINKDGYIGISTKEEIKYAYEKGKEILSLEPLQKDQWYY